MSTALLSTTQRPLATGLNMPMERHARFNARLLITLIAVLVLHALALLALALMPPGPARVPTPKPIMVRMVTLIPEPPLPKPIPPKPVVKPKLVPIVKDLPKPKPLPILVAPKSAPSPVVTAPVEKIDKPLPKVVAETAPAAPPAPAQKAAPAPTKQIDGLKFSRPLVLDYPESARAAGIEGTTTVRTCVSVDGAVDSATVQHSARNDALDRAAITAVKKSRFVPYRENGVAFPACALVPVQFGLED